MAIIGFWSGSKKESGQTVSIASIATQMAIEHNYKILLIDATFDDDSLERCFWNVNVNAKKEIMPGIMAGALIAFTMSIDDFVISYFTAGNGVTNLSIEIYSMAKRGIRPTVNALATIMVSLVLISVLISNNLSIRKKKEV